jgi:tetratricopeptide (TPR) repeat protein
MTGECREQLDRLLRGSDEARRAGDLAAALRGYEEAIGYPGLEPVQLAMLARTIAEVHDYEDRIDEAERWYLRAAELVGESDPVGNQAALSIHHGLQQFYASIGDQAKAARAGERVSAILRRTEDMGLVTRILHLGEGEPNARGRRFNMRARFFPCEEALQAHRRSNSPASDSCLLAQYFHSKGWHSLAGQVYEFAYHQDRARFTLLHPAVATTLSHAAELRRAMGDLGAAEAMEAEAERIRERLRERDAAALASGEPGTLAAYYAQLGTEAEMASDFVLATSLYRLAMAHEPADTKVWYFIHNNLGYCMNQRGRHAEAEELCRRAIVIDGARPNAHKNLGLALKGLGRLREAAAALLDSVRVCGGEDPRGCFELIRMAREHPGLMEEHPEVAEWIEEAKRIVLGEEEGA